MPYPYAPEEPWHVATSTQVGPAVRSQSDQPASRRLQLSIRDILVVTGIFSFTFAAFLNWFAGLFCAIYTGVVFSVAYLAFRPTWREQLSRFDRKLLTALAALLLMQAAIGYCVGYIRPTLSTVWMEALVSVGNIAALILSGVAALAFAHNLGNLWTPDPFLLPACARALAASAIVSMMVLLCSMSRGPSDQMYWHGHERIVRTCRQFDGPHAPDVVLGGEQMLVPELGGLVAIQWRPTQIRFERDDGVFTYLKRPSNRTYVVTWRHNFGVERRIGAGSLDAPP